MRLPFKLKRKLSMLQIVTLLKSQRLAILCPLKTPLRKVLFSFFVFLIIVTPRLRKIPMKRSTVNSFPFSLCLEL